MMTKMMISKRSCEETEEDEKEKEESEEEENQVNRYSLLWHKQKN